MSHEKPLLIFAIDGSAQRAVADSNIEFSKECLLDLCQYEYSLPISQSQRATVIINADTPTELQFNDAADVTLKTLPSDTINSARIILGGTIETSPHSEAISYFYRYIDYLSGQGWQRYIMPNEARLSGDQARNTDSPRHVLGKPVITGPRYDPGVRLDREQWLTMPTLSTWMFYKDGVYLTFRVQRRDSREAPEDKGSYLFTVSLESEANFYQRFFEGDARERWKTLLPGELERMRKERNGTEAQLKTMGIRIDERYQDPVIKALQ